MPKDKSRMHERLIAEGCPVDPLDPEPESSNLGPRIHPLSDDENRIFDLSTSGGTGYILDVAIGNPAHARS
jgi:hypothetical protein